LSTSEATISSTSRIRTTGRQLGAIRVEQGDAEGLQHARAAVGRGAATDAEHDPPGAVVECGAQQLPHAEGAGGQRGGVGQLAEARGRGELDHRRGAVARDDRVDRAAVRPGDPSGERDVAGAQRGGHGPLTAVGDGAEQQLCVGQHPGDPLGDRDRGVLGRQAALERIGGDDDAHGGQHARPGAAARDEARQSGCGPYFSSSGSR
jgi:hypothetical protein